VFNSLDYQLISRAGGRYGIEPFAELAKRLMMIAVYNRPMPEQRT
jgi:hypothetical protein